VLVDATIVRMILVPAVMQLLGDRTWWIPRWLDRLIPPCGTRGARRRLTISRRSGGSRLHPDRRKRAVVPRRRGPMAALTGRSPDLLRSDSGHALPARPTETGLPLTSADRASRGSTADSHPLGQDASGYIAYNEDGYVFVAIMRSAQPVCGRRSAERNHGRNGRGCRGLRVVLRPLRVPRRRGHPSRGAQPISQLGRCGQERLVTINGNRLTLSTRPLLLEGRRQTARLLWERL
jgi:Lipocalin-like domain